MYVCNIISLFTIFYVLLQEPLHKEVQESESKTCVLVQTVNSSNNNNKRSMSCNENESKRFKKCSKEETNEFLCSVCGVLCNKETHICDFLQFVPSIECPTIPLVQEQITKDQNRLKIATIQNATNINLQLPLLKTVSLIRDSNPSKPRDKYCTSLKLI
jgi:hypothetical protein